MTPRNPRHPQFKKEALKPGPTVNHEKIKTHTETPARFQEYPEAKATTEAISTLLGWVLAMCVIAYIPNIFKGKPE